MLVNHTEKKKNSKKLHKDVACFLEQIIDATFHKTSAKQPLTTHLKNLKTCWTQLKEQCYSIDMEASVLAD